MLRILGMAVLEMIRSATESIQRNKYIGSWRLGSILIIKRTEKFPRRAPM
jgi:hypothetical protein